MTSTLGVALITSLSTLAGAGVAGCITLAVSRINNGHQLALANAERSERRAASQSEARKDCYVKFLNQLSAVEHALNLTWRNHAPRELRDVPDFVKPVTIELDSLSPLANLVILEGPHPVSFATQTLQVRLMLESVAVLEAAKKSLGNPPCLHDEDEYFKIQMTRAESKSSFIKSAQEGIRGTSTPDRRQTDIPSREPPLATTGLKMIVET
jgi:hypothetical protein